MRKHIYIGMDVHKETIVIAIAEGPGDGEVREYGTIANSLKPLSKTRSKTSRNPPVAC